MTHCMHWTESRHDSNMGVCHFPLWNGVRNTLPLWIADEMKPINKEVYCSNCPARRTLNEIRTDDPGQTTDLRQLLPVLHCEPSSPVLVGSA